MEWKNEGKLANDAEIDEFEESHHIHLNQKHRAFLREVVNGGAPLHEKYIHTENCPGGAGAVHGAFGVNHPKQYYDLGHALEQFRFALPGLIPFGYDQGNGTLFLDNVDRPGQLIYVPWEEVENRPMPRYHVADSISAFLAASPSPPDDPDWVWLA